MDDVESFSMGRIGRAVGGTASFGAQLEGQIRPLVKQMQAVMVENCGHYLAEERPERVIEELLRFFNEPTEETS